MKTPTTSGTDPDEVISKKTEEHPQKNKAKHHFTTKDGQKVQIGVLPPGRRRSTHRLIRIGEKELQEDHSPEWILIRLSELGVSYPVSLYENLRDDLKWPYGETRYRHDLGGHQVSRLLSHQVALAIQESGNSDPNDFRVRAARRMQLLETDTDLLKETIGICLNGRSLTKAEKKEKAKRGRGKEAKKEHKVSESSQEKT